MDYDNLQYIELNADKKEPMLSVQMYVFLHISFPLLRCLMFFFFF